MFVLIHSPFVGPFTWSLVADQLRQRGFKAATPSLHGVEQRGVPYWKQHADTIAQALRSVPSDSPLILVGETAAGVLLPAIRQALSRPVAAYIFVDAGIPEDGKSRSDLAQVESPTAARVGAADVRLPQWRDEDLQALIPDARLRAGVLAELHPQSLAFRQEPIPVFAGWPDAPCGYIKFSRGFQSPALHAQQAGWMYEEFEGGHFYFLVEPLQIATTLITMAERMGVLLPQAGGSREC